MAPPSALQLASPTRWKLSRPLSPSISVVQPLPGTHDGIDEQAASNRAVARTSKRFMVFSSPLGELFELDARGADDRAPALGFLFHEGRGGGRAETHRLRRHFGQPAQDVRILQRFGNA